MDKNRFKTHDSLQAGDSLPSNCDGVGYLLRGEEQILQSITAGAPLPEILNTICSALDCEIGNVVSLVSLLNERAEDAAVMAENAKTFGLHMLCSIGVIADNYEKLGTLEMYACEPWNPSPQELDIIERATCLAAIAIERRSESLGHDDAMVPEMRLIRKRVLDWPETLN